MTRVAGPFPIALVAVVALAPAALHAGETGAVAADDGVRIVWESQGSGEPALVMVHCWACDRQFFAEQVRDLATDHRVVTLDLPGHGESGADRERWSVTGLGADVVRVVDELGLERVILIGHSMGGPVALAAAAALRGRVLGVVLVDTVHDAEMAISREMVEQIATPFEADYEGTMRRFVPAMFPDGADPSLPEWVIERALRADRAAAVALMRDFEHVDNAALLREAGVPIRAVNAAPMPPMIPDTAIETNRRYADFDAVKIGGVGHYLYLEKPEEFDRALRSALAEIVAAAH